MKSFKKIALAIFVAIMTLMMSVTVFAADSPAKSKFNASIKKATVVYNGKEQKPTVTVKTKAGKTLKEGKHYTVSIGKKCKNAGTYTVTIKGKGKYAGSVQTVSYKIKPKTQKLTIQTPAKTYKYKNLKKKSQYFNPGVTNKLKSGITYKSSSKKITVTKKGSIKIGKGIKKGTYTVTVTSKKKNYKTISKTIKITVK